MSFLRDTSRRGWMWLHEKGGKRHEMPCNHNLEAYIDAYIGAAAIAGDAKKYLFRTTRSKAGTLTGNPMTQSQVCRMIRRRTFATGIKTRVGNHSFRATGITQYLKNGGRREIAQQMAVNAPATAHKCAFTLKPAKRPSNTITGSAATSVESHQWWKGS